MNENKIKIKIFEYFILNLKILYVENIGLGAEKYFFISSQTDLIQIIQF